jgi:zinc/manganese transport system substrate-binding protein
VLKPVAIVLSALVAVTLAGCTASQPDNAGDGVVRVVASTNVYGDIAASVGGGDIEVTSIIDDPAQDPHEFEANARVQLALSRADVVIENGGGYDDFVDVMLGASGNDAADVVNVVELSNRDAGADGFNEHVWYDYPTIAALADSLAEAFSAVDPDGAAGYAANAAALTSEIDGLIARQAALGQRFAGAGVVVTEPVPLYVLDAIGLENLTPPEFSEAIEEDTDIPPTLLQRVLDLISDGSTDLVAYNAQTGGPQTDAVLDRAAETGVPAIAVFETLPTGTGYVGWQQGVLDDIEGALAP